MRTNRHMYVHLYTRGTGGFSVIELISTQHTDSPCRTQPKISHWPVASSQELRHTAPVQMLWVDMKLRQ